MVETKIPDPSNFILNTPPGFHVMVKPRGAVCNLDCQYCYYLSKQELYPGSPSRMSDELLETFTRQYIESQHTPEVTFAWQGGEPTLMGLDFFERAVELQQKYRKSGTRITNSLQTNAVNLDDRWAAFFRDHQFLIGVSLDGPQPVHDNYRVDKGGAGTHARVLKGIQILQAHQVAFNILCCVHSANAGQPLEVYRFFRDVLKTPFIQFIPIVERATQGDQIVGEGVTPRSVSAVQYGQFLIAIFDEWVRHDVGQVFIQIFDVALAAWSGLRPGLCIFEETCGLGVAMEHNGDLYACDHYVRPGYLLGNIQQEHLSALVASPFQVRFGQAKQKSLPRSCQSCEVRFVCNGGCPKDRFRKTPSGEPGLSYLCDGYRSFFQHISEPMKIMAALLKMKLPPANVMEIMASQGNIPQASLPLRNPKRKRRR